MYHFYDTHDNSDGKIDIIVENVIFFGQNFQFQRSLVLDFAFLEVQSIWACAAQQVL